MIAGGRGCPCGACSRAARSATGAATVSTGARTPDVFPHHRLNGLKRQHPLGVCVALSDALDAPPGGFEQVCHRRGRSTMSAALRTQPYLCGPPPMVDAALELLMSPGEKSAAAL